MTNIRVDRSSALVCLRFPLLERAPGLAHAITTRMGGVSSGVYATANLGMSIGDDPAAVLTNRRLAAELVAAARTDPVTVRQVHGVTALLAKERNLPEGPLGDGDMVATATPDMPLLVQVADCVPFIVFDAGRTAIAAVHAGWRGTAASAGREAVASMQRFFGSRPADLLVGIGPAIGVCCYEVGEDVAAAVQSAVPGQVVIRIRSGQRPHLDLEAALYGQLCRAGVPAGQIARAGLCTACNLDLFYSHRREGIPSGRFGAVVSLTR